MRFRTGQSKDGNSPPQMAPMIDVVFLLLILSMLTLRILEPEGEFGLAAPAAAADSERVDESPQPEDPADRPHLPVIDVSLRAGADGALESVHMGRRNLGSDEKAFQRLNAEILKIVGRPGNPLTRDLKVVIACDPHLHFRHVICAMSACRGRKDPRTGNMITYVDHISLVTRQKKAQ